MANGRYTQRTVGQRRTPETPELATTEVDTQDLLDLRGQVSAVRRAQAVVDYLAARGVTKGRLTAKGYGQENPIADNATVDGRSRNRRVELHPIR